VIATSDTPATTPPEGVVLVLFKGVIAAAAVWLFFQPLATAPGLATAVGGTILAYLAAHVAARGGLRLRAGLVIAVAIVGLGHVLSHWILARPSETTTAPIQWGDAVYLGLGCLGIFFAIRLLSQRVRAFAILEVGVIVAAVGHTFADHRHQRIHQPRWLSDWAWSNGIDPQTILTGAGIAVVVLAAIMMLRRQRVAKLVLSLLLLLLAGLGAYALVRDQHISVPPDTNSLGLTSEQKKSSSGSSRQKPDPVAIAVLHDDLGDDADVLYFRQTVRSRLAGDRLVEDGTGAFDRDVIPAYPGAAPIRSEPTQDPGFHRKLPTSMFLMVAHPQPFGIGHPFEYRPLDNPDPRRFVAAYEVDSYVATSDVSRMLGRTTTPSGWTDAERAHYLELPDDPRYAALAQILVREVDPRFVNDQVMVAYAIKRYLEVQGFYSLQQKEMVGTDPTAAFLFGQLKGYCVHFAHAAVFLFRSQGIPARVALGYAVQVRRRGAGSSLLIMGREAHAWPEIYLDGVGWVTFDIYPEQSDEPPPTPVDDELESLLGELARKDPTGGRGDPDAGRYIPWGAIGTVTGLTLLALLALGYAIKAVRRLRGSNVRAIYVGMLDRLSDLGHHRQRGESRERHAIRVGKLAPSFTTLTEAHLRWALGPPHGKATVAEHAALARAARGELRRTVKLRRRIVAALHPFGWWLTR
jgi:transglutaminase-like putative cysteine protease